MYGVGRVDWTWNVRWSREKEDGGGGSGRSTVCLVEC